MLKKIKYIKDLGIFNDYQWDNALNDFKKYNLIYGWNGAGKTTLTRLYTLANGESHDDFSSCTYKLGTDNGDVTENDKYPREIRVFNHDYIKRNITLESGKTNPIFILGDENTELIEQIKSDEKSLNGDSDSPDNIGLIQTLRRNKEEQNSINKLKDKGFTDVAKLIGSCTTGVLSRNYRKPDAENNFNKMKSKQLLSEEEMTQCKLTLKQQPMSSELNSINVSSILVELAEHQAKAKGLLEETVESLVIERLKNEQDISEWVETGLTIHTDKNLSHCEFCEQEIPKERITSLMSHFNEADKLLKVKIDNLVSDLRKVYSDINELAVIDKANLFEEFRGRYEFKINNYIEVKAELLRGITSFGTALNSKKMNTTDKIELTKTIETNEYKEVIDELNRIISEHCDKAKKFDVTRCEAASKIEKHYLSELWDEVRGQEEELKKLTAVETTLIDGDSDKDSLGIAALQERILDNKNKISSSGPACDELNEKLNTFLGRSEIIFEIEEEGYVIKRSGNIVTNLSEGEKTAIAFVYFTIHMKDREFDLADGIVVIDDPISSLDANSLFQAFAFLKNAVKDAYQVFIFTHNFDFMRLIIGWLKRSVKNHSEFYMVNNRIENNERVAYISELDSALKNHDSEYQYLFKTLDGFTSDGTIGSVYHIPNVARKVLETFLMLMYPDNTNSFKKLEKVDFDEIKKSAIYKFTNDQSHMTGKGFDPSLVAECQKNVGYLLEMIESVFPTHFSSLKQA